MRRLCVLAAAAALLASCAKTPKKEGALAQALSAALHSPPCAGAVPGNWTASIPVPLRQGGGREFAVFFYALPERLGDRRMGTASGRAVVALGADKALSCARGSGSRPALDLLERFSPAALRLGVPGIQEKRAELLSLDEQVGAAYASGRPPGALAARFADLFSLLAEPPFLRDYGRLNPGFWLWLKGQGAALPAGLF
ncbi:MAG: hypothetical protein KGI84_08740 [Elusimicrobia bacterium]|nr:hypothetical protein [Elusimicrobiota bacterium]